jgi:hypothetical protein
MRHFRWWSGWLILSILLAACASAAPPPPATSAPPTVVAASDAFLAPSATVPPPTAVPPTLAPPTATPVPPTATIVLPTDTPVPPTATLAPPTATALPPSPTPDQATGQSWIANATILGFYGRAWGVAPILGRLGGYQNANEMAADVATFSAGIAPLNGGKPIIPEMHLIYALAVPCSGNSDCLSYLDDTGANLVTDYIEPAQQRGWLVFLDTQLGRSDPVAQVQRMIAKGYLKYDNVEVALDPEFHVVPGHLTPGIPVGTIEAEQVNQVQQILDDYVQQQHLPHRKLLVVHQFGDPLVGDGVPFMIQNKTDVKDYPNVDLVITADGFGSPDAKVSKYNKMTDATAYPFIKYRGLKLFPPNPYEHAGHYDRPMLTWRQVYGLDPTPGHEYIKDPPNLIIIN